MKRLIHHEMQSKGRYRRLATGPMPPDVERALANEILLEKARYITARGKVLRKGENNEQ